MSIVFHMKKFLEIENCFYQFFTYSKIKVAVTFFQFRNFFVVWNEKNLEKELIK